ncbi:Hypothetical protein EHI5A_018670 [Entamoeba histolytica KU27]|nr:Hypothetical protein EHI5A_018670 [Entamoeba histolytica KU27]
MTNEEEDIYRIVKEMIKGTCLEKYLTPEIIKDCKHYEKEEVVKLLQTMGLEEIIQKNQYYFE